MEGSKARQEGAQLSRDGAHRVLAAVVRAFVARPAPPVALVLHEE